MVEHCAALYCGTTAINGGNTVSDCYGYCTGSGDGIGGSNVSNSFGVSNSGSAISAFENVTNCYGEAFGSTGRGISTQGLAVGCRGIANSNGSGLSAATASHCYGASQGGHGLIANEATGCEGSANGSGTGVKCSYTAMNCRGFSVSGVGVSASTATNCHGVSNNGSGLVATTANTCFGQTSGIAASSYGIDCSTTGIAMGCRAIAPNSSAVPTVLRAFIANSCVVTGGTIAIGNKYNMP